MATDDSEPIFDPEYSTSRWSLRNVASAAATWVFVGGITLLILVGITVFTVSILGIAS
jgi:hypothetical protein